MRLLLLNRIVSDFLYDIVKVGLICIWTIQAVISVNAVMNDLVQQRMKVFLRAFDKVLIQSCALIKRDLELSAENSKHGDADLDFTLPIHFPSRLLLGKGIDRAKKKCAKYLFL